MGEDHIKSLSSDEWTHFSTRPPSLDRVVATSAKTRRQHGWSAASDGILDIFVEIMTSPRIEPG